MSKKNFYLEQLELTNNNLWSRSVNPQPKPRSMKNRYAARAKLTEKELRDVVRMFARDVEAALIGHAVGVSRTTVNEYLRKIRLALAEQCALDGAIRETGRNTEMLFSVHPERSSSTAKAGDSEALANNLKVDVLRGAIHAPGRLGIEILPGKDLQALKLVRAGKIRLRGWKSNGYVRVVESNIDLDFYSPDQEEILAELGKKNEGEKVVALFLAYLRARISRMRGVCPNTLRLHLKECEYRFNNARTGGSLSRRILAILRERPLA
jgi:transposase